MGVRQVTATDTAQRRLLEALAAMHAKSTGGYVLTDLAEGLRLLAGIAPDDTFPGVFGLYHALADLAETVRTDLDEKETSS
jgi:hypothetical protein